jgi:hypothetical protein
MALDEMARERATQVLVASEHSVDDGALRARLRELGVINPRAFLPGSRSQWRRSRLPVSTRITRARPDGRRTSRRRRPWRRGARS